MLHGTDGAAAERQQCGTRLMFACAERQQCGTRLMFACAERQQCGTRLMFACAEHERKAESWLKDVVNLNPATQMFRVRPPPSAPCTPEPAGRPPRDPPLATLPTPRYLASA
jgi:hypothetical protein